MTAAIPTCEPSEITRGETVQWTRSLSNYPASDGWSLTTYFRGVGKGVDVAGEDAGAGEYANELTAAQSGTMAPGRYNWQAWVKKGSGAELEQRQVGAGKTTVLLGFVDVDASTPVDGRSEAEVSLANLRKAIDRAASSGTAEYQIAGRMKRRYSLTELIELENRLIQVVNQERQAAALKKGAPFLTNIYTRFR